MHLWKNVRSVFFFAGNELQPRIIGTVIFILYADYLADNAALIDQGIFFQALAET